MKQFFAFLLVFIIGCSPLPAEVPISPGKPAPVLSATDPAEASHSDTTLAAPTDTPIPPTPNPPLPTLARDQTPAPLPSSVPYLLAVQPGSPARLPNFAHPDLGCEWLGLAGQVFDAQGNPKENLVAEVGGTLAGVPITGLAVTGSSANYGPGSYEIQLGAAPLDSVDTAWVRIYNLDGLPLSELVYFSTTADCAQNLILLNFVQHNALPDHRVFFPLLPK